MNRLTWAMGRQTGRNEGTMREAGEAFMIRVAETERDAIILIIYANQVEKSCEASFESFSGALEAKSLIVQPLYALLVTLSALAHALTRQEGWRRSKMWELDLGIDRKQTTRDQLSMLLLHECFKLGKVCDAIQ